MGEEDGYWRLLAMAGVVGVLGAAGTLAFLVAEHLLQLVVWGHHDELPTGFFDGSWKVAPVAIAAFALIGVLRWRWRLDHADPNFVDEMVHGDAQLGHSLRLGAIALASLVGGGSVGRPEAPVASLGAGIGHEVGRRLPFTESHRDDLTFAGIAGVFGPIASFPFAAPVIAMEAQAGERFGSYRRLLPGLVASTVGLAVLYPVIGTPFLRAYDVGGQLPLVAWWIPAAVGLGAVGGLVGLLTMAVIGVVARAGQRIQHPVTRGVAAGVLIAVLGFVVPLSLFSGRTELGPIVGSEAAVVSAVVIAATAVKMVTLAISLRWGGFGGAIFPLIFIGSSLGVLVHRVFDGIPLVVSVTALAGAVTVAVVPLPLMVLILVIFLFGMRVETSAVPSAAVVASYLVAHVSGLRARLLSAD